MKKIHIVKVMPTEIGFSYYMVYAEDRKLIKFWDEEKYGDDETPLFIKPLIRWLRENKNEIQIVEFKVVGVKNAEMYDEEIHTESTDVDSLQIPVDNEAQLWMDEENPAETIIREYLS